MKEKTVTILCSGVALGVYIPALLVSCQLRRLGIPTEVVVLENLIYDEKRQKINENKKAFHQSFAVALMGQKLARDIRPSLDPALTGSLLEGWGREDRRDFMVFSGFWMPVIEDYRIQRGPLALNIDLVHMDAEISASWKSFKNALSGCNNIWLFSMEKRNLIYEIPVSQKPPIPYADRRESFVIHGGGWGMGTYQGKIPELRERGIPLDIVAYDMAETLDRKEGNRYFMVDPTWSPWVKNPSGEHEFPLFSEIKDSGTHLFKNREEYHELFDVIRESRAIISKPGGATLLDSLAAATPIVMLDPFGGYEQKNAELWEAMGFGISYDRWREADYSPQLLEILHTNLLKARGTFMDYAKEYAYRNRV